MKRLNNKGFMMAEVVVVSSVILVALTSLYISYNKVIATYQERITYNDINTFYKAVFYRDRLGNYTIENNYRSIETLSTSEECYLVTKDNISKITTENNKLKKYLNYLDNILEEDSKVIILKQCNNDKCTFAYVDVTEEASS